MYLHKDIEKILKKRIVPIGGGFMGKYDLREKIEFKKSFFGKDAVFEVIVFPVLPEESNRIKIKIPANYNISGFGSMEKELEVVQ